MKKIIGNGNKNGIEKMSDTQRWNKRRKAIACKIRCGLPSSSYLREKRQGHKVLEKMGHTVLDNSIQYKDWSTL